jgi:hypothetical protein
MAIHMKSQLELDKTIKDLITITTEDIKMNDLL